MIIYLLPSTNMRILSVIVEEPSVKFKAQKLFRQLSRVIT